MSQEFAGPPGDRLEHVHGGNVVLLGVASGVLAALTLKNESAGPVTVDVLTGLAAAEET